MTELFLGTVYCKYSVYYILLGGVTRQQEDRMTTCIALITEMRVQ